MAFTGTLQKCTACGKTVYFVDELTADGVVYHKSCFRCNHCKGTLQLFKKTGSLEKSFETGTQKASRSLERSLSMDVEKRPPSKFAAFFSGTQEKCISCEKTVYPLEKVSIDGMTYHKSCFKCCHGGCSLNPSNHIAHEGRLYCKHHHAQLFLEKGNYSKLEVLPAVKASVEDGTF